MAGAARPLGRGHHHFLENLMKASHLLSHSSAFPSAPLLFATSCQDGQPQFAANLLRSSSHRNQCVRPARCCRKCSGKVCTSCAHQLESRHSVPRLASLGESMRVTWPAQQYLLLRRASTQKRTPAILASDLGDLVARLIQSTHSSSGLRRDPAMR